MGVEAKGIALSPVVLATSAIVPDSTTRVCARSCTPNTLSKSSPMLLGLAATDVVVELNPKDDI